LRLSSLGRRCGRLRSRQTPLRSVFRSHPSPLLAPLPRRLRLSMILASVEIVVDTKASMVNKELTKCSGNSPIKPQKVTAYFGNCRNFAEE
jgi:hypothetical protein